MEIPVDILAKLDVVNLVAIAAILWWFNSRVDRKLDKFENNMDQRFEKIDQRFEKVDQRFDKLEEKITDIDRRLCRLEGAFASKDCCMIKEDRSAKKAE